MLTDPSGAFPCFLGRRVDGTCKDDVFTDIKDATLGVSNGIGTTASNIGTAVANPGSIADNTANAYHEGGLGLAVNQFNPVYGIITSYDKMIALANAGCVTEASAAGWDGAFNAASTAAIAAGGAGLATRAYGSADAAAANAAARASSLPEISEANAGHTFRSAPGHLAADTPANRALLRGAAQSGNRVGTYNDIDTYTKLLPDGRQVWVEVRNGKITNGGVNNTPYTWDPRAGKLRR